MAIDVYSALSNPVRARLIVCLSRGAKNVTQLIATCNLAQSAVSQHLAKLKKAGVVKSQKEGKEVWYSLKYKKVADISRLLIDVEKEAQ